MYVCITAIFESDKLNIPFSSLLVISCVVHGDVVLGLHLLHVVAHFNSVHHVVAWLFLHVVLGSVPLHKGGQSLWLPVLQLLVDRCLLRDRVDQFLNLHVLHLELALLDRCLLPLGLGLHLARRLDQLDVLLVVVELLLEVVDLLDELDVLLHETLIDVFMGLVGLRLSGAQVVDILLEILPQHFELLGTLFTVLLVALDLLSHVGLVEFDNLLLQLFIVTDFVQSIVNLVLETLHFLFLFL